MDYPHRTPGLKLLGHARVIECSRKIQSCSSNWPRNRSAVKWSGLFLIQVVFLRLELPQYITPRFTLAEVEQYAAGLKARISELEAQLAESWEGLVSCPDGYYDARSCPLEDFPGYDWSFGGNPFRLPFHKTSDLLQRYSEQNPPSRRMNESQNQRMQQALDHFRIETPSWGFADTGTASASFSRMLPRSISMTS